MTHEDIEPFIILPYGEIQDTIFFIEESLRMEYSLLIELAYKKLSNEILQDNLIKVVIKRNEIIIFHIYPTSYKEKYSNRLGQNLIIGYIIKKNFFRKNTEIVIYCCNLFFEAVRYCGYIKNSNLGIPSRFLYKVNIKHFNKYIISYLMKKRTEMQLITKKKSLLINITLDERLREVYLFIKNKKTIYSEYWIFVDLENIDYYKKLNRSYNIILKDY